MDSTSIEYATSFNGRSPAVLARLHEARAAAQRLNANCVQQDETGRWRAVTRTSAEARTHLTMLKAEQQTEPRRRLARLKAEMVRETRWAGPVVRVIELTPVMMRRVP